LKKYLPFLLFILLAAAAGIVAVLYLSRSEDKKYRENYAEMSLARANSLPELKRIIITHEDTSGILNSGCISREKPFKGNAGCMLNENDEYGTGISYLVMHDSITSAEISAMVHTSDPCHVGG
jgi:hypothetical protein